MKKFKVLEAHQGDKFYKPEDPETGTRIADPNAVDHLVRLGVLEEMQDVDVPPPPADDPSTIAGLRLQIEVLENDRADMRAAFDNEIVGLRDQIITMTQDRETAGKEAADTIAGLREHVGTLNDGVEAMRGEIAALTKRFEEKPASNPASDAEAHEAASPARRSRSAN